MLFEETFNENLSLRRALNLAKLGLDKSESDYAHLKQLFEQLTKNHDKLSNDYEHIQKYNHQVQAEKQEIERFMESRVEELKQLVEQKQREIEDIQIRIIPSLDQDMIRVKLIGEMEGPYQEAMNKKEAQIAGLQKDLNESERKQSLTELELEHCRRQRDQQTSELKIFYDTEVSRLNSRLDALLSSSEGREKDRQLARKLRKDVQESRALLQLKEDECTELRREKDSLREQISQLIIKLSSKSNNDTSEKALFKVQLFKLQEQIKSKDIELERLMKQMGKEKEAGRQHVRKIEDLEGDVERLKGEESQKGRVIKDMEQRLKRSGDDKDELKATISRLQRQTDALNGQLHSKEQEVVRLRAKLQTHDKENNEYNYHEKMEEFQEKKAAHSKWTKQEAALNQEIADLKRQNRLLKDRLEEIGHSNSQTNEQRKSPSRPSPPHATIKQGSEIKILEEKIKILKKKLQQANGKIMQLLKDKISQQPEPSKLAADISISPEAYQARDAALVPLIGPYDVQFGLEALRMGGYPLPPMPERMLPVAMPILPRNMPPIDQFLYRPY